MEDIECDDRYSELMGTSKQIVSYLEEVRITYMAPVDLDTLFDYVKFNDAEELQDALQDEKVDPKCTNLEGWTLSHVDCKLGTVECVKVLTNDPGINVNAGGPGRLSPIFLAMQYYKMNCLKIFQEHPDINLKFQNQEGQTIIQFPESRFKSRYGKDVIEYVKRLSTFPVTNHASNNELLKDIDICRTIEIVTMIHIADTDGKHQPPILVVCEGKPSTNTVQAQQSVVVQA